VDFENGLIRIEDSKNQEPREFFFTPELRETLEAQRERTEALEQSTGQIIPWVFWRLKGPGVPKDGTPVRSFRKAWLSACVAAGLGTVLKDEGGRVKKAALRIPHDFRRTAVRNLEMAGVPRSTAMAMVGHKTESIYRRYAIVDAGMMRLGAARLAKLHQTQAKAARKVVPMTRR
jgi:integrase